MGRNRRDVSDKEVSSSADKRFAEECKKLRLYYDVVGRGAWWWLMDDSVATIGAQLSHEGYCVLDSFLLPADASSLRDEVQNAHHDGRLLPAGLINGKIATTSEASYADAMTRGDVCGWFEGAWSYGDGLETYLVKLGTLISELATPVPAIKAVTSRSQAMVACYPGGGARYVKHVDNDGKHTHCKTRVLTAILYLNDWRQGDGGELVIFHENGSERRVVEPVAGRVLLFWSDWRTPHEVRPARKPRYAITIWLLNSAVDDKVKQEADEFSAASCELSGVVPMASVAIGASGTVVFDAAGLPEESTVVGEVDGLAYSWESLPDDGWQLHVEQKTIDGARLDVSSAQIRLESEGKTLCLPLPRGCAPVAPKWSRKCGRLSIACHPVDSTPNTASSLTNQLRSGGWGLADGFLPGPEADSLRGILTRVSSRCVRMCDTDVQSALLDCARLLKSVVASMNVQSVQGLELEGPWLRVYPAQPENDQFYKTRGERRLTLIVNLNPFWTANHGGGFRIGDSGDIIQPLHGRLIVLSKEVNYEVLPTLVACHAVAFWFPDR